MTNLVINVPGEYVSLGLVMQSALEQASKGKGRERHASEGEAYEDQIICEVARRVGLGYPLGQAVKKIYESQRIGGERGVAELLGALNYIAAAIIVMREGMETAPKAEGCETLVEKDAPQTPQELYDRILSCNPATYGKQSTPEDGMAEIHRRLMMGENVSLKCPAPRTPTGEELAEMAEEEPHV